MKRVKFPNYIFLFMSYLHSLFLSTVHRITAGQQIASAVKINIAPTGGMLNAIIGILKFRRGFPLLKITMPVLLLGTQKFLQPVEERLKIGLAYFEYRITFFETYRLFAYHFYGCQRNKRRNVDLYKPRHFGIGQEPPCP